MSAAARLPSGQWHPHQPPPPLAGTSVVVIGLLQLHNQNRLRELDISMQVNSAFGQEGLARHHGRISSKEYRTYDDDRWKPSAEGEVALYVVGVTYEGMGLLLKRRWESIELMEDLLSSRNLESWPKTRPVAGAMRPATGHPAWIE